MEPILKVIDLHCDTITVCEEHKLSLYDKSLQLSAARLPKSIRLGQCMAVFMPDELRGEKAEAYFDRVYAYFLAEIQRHCRKSAWVTEASKIKAALSDKDFAMMLTVEGGSVLNGKLKNVNRIYDLGVRMMTLTWNDANEICGGADTNIGFTDFGRKTVAEMECLGMAVDVSHLSDKGFFELCEFASRPFAASHSNSRRICNHRRNLTDEMFAQIVKRGGIAGLNYCRDFIREDGENGTIDDLLRHAHHFLEIGGEDTLALGSDFDGAKVPDYINGIEKLEFLIEAFEKSGIPKTVVDKILFKNAARYFAGIENNTIPCF